jgi:hypothetical protein
LFDGVSLTALKLVETGQAGDTVTMVYARQ